MSIFNRLFEPKRESDKQEIIPTYHPDDKSQGQTLLRHFETYKRITESEALELYGIKRLSGRVHEINGHLELENLRKREGEATRWIYCVLKQITNRRGRKIRVTDYYELRERQ